MLWLSLALAADQVRVSGRVESTVPGPIRVELLKVDEGVQLLVAEQILDEPGEFALTVSGVTGTVHLRAAADPDRDGISADDPQVVHPPLQLIGDPVGGLTLTLVLPGAAP